jgi:hypothetical protein
MAALSGRRNSNRTSDSDRLSETNGRIDSPGMNCCNALEASYGGKQADIRHRPAKQWSKTNILTGPITGCCQDRSELLALLETLHDNDSILHETGRQSSSFITIGQEGDGSYVPQQLFHLPSKHAVNESARQEYGGHMCWCMRHYFSPFHAKPLPCAINKQRRRECLCSPFTATAKGKRVFSLTRCAIYLSLCLPRQPLGQLV